eukprot:11000977-Heterocapsa_arctica.AAC.1
MPSKAHGLDNWSVDDFKSLPTRALEGLLVILLYVERFHVWPDASMWSRMALCPKAGSDSTDDLRPLTILSIIYRLWARLRWAELAAWIVTWIDATVYGGIERRSALDAMQNLSHI